MIINLTTEDIDACLGVKEVVSVLENVLKAYGEAKHFVMAPRSFLDRITNESSKFSETIRIFASDAKSRQFELGSLLSKVQYAVDIDLDSKDAYSIVKEDDVTYYKVGYGYFLDSSSTQECCIVGEGLLDIDFYSKVAYFYKIKNKLSSTGMKFCAVSGGGNQTREVFDNEKNKNKLCLCLVDNDKKHPRAAIGTTAKKFNNVVLDKTLSLVYVLDVHEAESLIPMRVIQEVVNDDGGEAKKIDAFDSLAKLIEYDETIKLYFDHKNGISLENAVSLDGKYGPYWINAITAMKKIGKYDCVVNVKCEVKCSNCIKIDGYGERLLSKSINKIDTMCTRDLEHSLSSQELKKRWCDIGGLFYTWACSPLSRVRL